MRSIATSVLLCFLAGVGYSAPPTVDFPKETKATSDYVILTPKTDAKTITYVKGFYNSGVNMADGVEPFPSAMLKDAKVFMLPVRGLPKGKYSFTGVASLNDEHTVFDFSILVGEGVTPPVPPNPIPPNPNPPIPDVLYDTPIKLYVVEETAQRSTAVTKMLLDLEFWNELEKQGYIMRPYDITSADAKRMGLDKIKQPTPFIAVVAKDGTLISSHPLPLTREGVKAILPKVKVSFKILEEQIPLSNHNPLQYTPAATGVPPYSFPQTPYRAGYTLPVTTAPYVVGQSQPYIGSTGTVRTPTNARMTIQSGIIDNCPT